MAPPGSPLAAAISPAHAWVAQEHLTANLVDQLSALLYGLSDGKGRKPKPVLRPGQVDEDAQTVTHKGLPMTIDEVDALRRRFESPNP